MKAVQLVLDETLILLVDEQARARSQSRSEFVRDALRAQVRALRRRQADTDLRRGYREHPERLVEVNGAGGIAQAWEEEDWSDVWRGAKSGGSASRRRTRKGRS